VDVTYEDPAEDLQALRERIDAERAAAVPDIWVAACDCLRGGLAATAEAARGEREGGRVARSGSGGGGGSGEASTSTGLRGDECRDDAEGKRLVGFRIEVQRL
jgi:hypothetical protein